MKGTSGPWVPPPCPFSHSFYPGNFWGIICLDKHSLQTLDLAHHQFWWLRELRKEKKSVSKAK